MRGQNTSIFDLTTQSNTASDLHKVAKSLRANIYPKTRKYPNPSQRVTIMETYQFLYQLSTGQTVSAQGTATSYTEAESYAREWVHGTYCYPGVIITGFTNRGHHRAY
jgi:hypothetical protein